MSLEKCFGLIHCLFQVENSSLQWEKVLFYPVWNGISCWSSVSNWTGKNFNISRNGAQNLSKNFRNVFHFFQHNLNKNKNSSYIWFNKTIANDDALSVNWNVLSWPFFTFIWRKLESIVDWQTWKTASAMELNVSLLSIIVVRPILSALSCIKYHLGVLKQCHLGRKYCLELAKIMHDNACQVYSYLCIRKIITRTIPNGMGWMLILIL